MRRPRERILHLVGPGGAGKTTVGPLLSARLRWQFLDLDLEFMRQEGDISAYIAAHGYEGYARRNVAVYLNLRNDVQRAAVVAMSSGFMTYPLEIEPRYRAVRRGIEADPLTALLLPSFDLETCVDSIVARQLERRYLASSRSKEEQRIRARFPVFKALECARFRSDASPARLALDLERFVRDALNPPG